MASSGSFASRSNSFRWRRGYRASTVQDPIWSSMRLPSPRGRKRVEVSVVVVLVVLVGGTTPGIMRSLQGLHAEG